MEGEVGVARRVASNAFNPFVAQIVTKVLLLGYAVVQYRALGGGELGAYFLAGYVLLYTSTISEWGLGTLLTREVAKERGSAEAVREDFRQTLALRLLISLALFVPVGLFILLYTSLFDLSAGGAWAVVVLTLSLLPGAFSGTVTSLLNAYERMTVPALVGIGTSVLNVALGLGAIALGWGIVGLAVAAFVSTVATAVYFARILRRDFPEVVGVSLAGLRVKRDAAVDLLKAGWPLMLNALLVGLFFRVDQFIIQPVVGDLGVEKYQAAYSYLNFVLLITPVVTLALFPRMARHARDDVPRLSYEYTFALKALLVLSGLIVVVTVWFAPLLVTIVTGGKAGYLPDSAVALQILIFFLPFSFVNGVTQYVLIALDKQRLITGAFALTVAFNVVANLVLIPMLGINGAALTTVFSELVLLGPFLLWVRSSIGPVPLAALLWRPLVAGGAAGVLMYALWSLFVGWKSGGGEFALYIGAGLGFALVYGVVLLLLRPFTSGEIASFRSVVSRRS
jgi:O-antigen/teichoic acid export membrane protein